MSECLPRPGRRLGSYPQKKESDLTEFEKNAAFLIEKVKTSFARNPFNQHNIIKKILHYEAPLIHCSEAILSQSIADLRENIQRNGLTEELKLQAFATIRETAGRTLGKRHFEVQLYAGWLMMHGILVEMETGEGKTLTTTLPACTAAMAGIPVHVITANDYLASRDAEIMRPLYERLGLQGGAVIEGMETDERKDIYQRPIVHTSNKQIVFDYLRDRIEMKDDTGLLTSQLHRINRAGKNQQRLLRGLCFALVDEADSVLIDEAKTPLIITQPTPNDLPPETFGDAVYLASSLVLDHDYRVDLKTQVIELTEAGENRLTNLIVGLPAHWKEKRLREQLVKKALTAELFYQKNKHYLVSNQKVQIIDEFTGRVMPDRAWEQGLHQIIEAKEGCAITDQREPLARISYQRFFNRYLRLAGTSGTVKEVATELHKVYGLKTVRVATQKPSQRRVMGVRIYRTVLIKQQAFLQRIAELYAIKRPVLIGTGSVAESMEVSLWLEQAGFPHRLLNADQNKHEADIIANAGQQQAITVATNMAGRGTDIALGTGVSELGGLHVIALSTNEALRIDRQLYGRCARQGDPGSAETIVSLQDTALEQYYSLAILELIGKGCSDNRPIQGYLARVILRLPQRYTEKKQRRIRKQLSAMDKQLSKILAFAGKFD